MQMSSRLLSFFPSIRKRFYKFVLKRVIGNFLNKNELQLDQLDVQLSTGTVVLSNVELNTAVCIANHLIKRTVLCVCAIQLLNDSLGQLPIRIVRGSVRHLKATIPWRSASAHPSRILLTMTWTAIHCKNTARSRSRACS